MIKKVSTHQLKKIISKPVPSISDHHRDEMAIPSYLHSNPLIRWLMWKRYEVISNMARFSKDMSVLEFGCGTGIFLPELTEKCETVYAIDLFPQYAMRLCEELDLKVTFKDQINNMENDSLDLIIAADVLEHLDDDQLDEYLKVFSAKLKPQGRLIVSGPTESAVYRIGRFIAGFSGKGDYHKTNIDKLIIAIKKRFEYLQMSTLPFFFPPYLFKICVFRNKDS